MSKEHEDTAEAKNRLAVAAGAALLGAGLILVMFILPAEFAVDPLGTGARLGLLDLGITGQQVQALEPAAANGTGPAAVLIVPQERGFHTETVEFKVGPRQGMEYKYRLDKGEALLYSWKTTVPVNFEFHAEPDGGPRGYAQTYEKSQGIRSVRHPHGAVLGHSRLVLGKRRRSGDYRYADERRLLQHVARISRRPAGQEQDVPVTAASRPGIWTGSREPDPWILKPEPRISYRTHPVRRLIAVGLSFALQSGALGASFVHAHLDDHDPDHHSRPKVHAHFNGHHGHRHADPAGSGRCGQTTTTVELLTSKSLSRSIPKASSPRLSLPAVSLTTAHASLMRRVPETVRSHGPPQGRPIESRGPPSFLS